MESWAARFKKFGREDETSPHDCAIARSSLAIKNIQANHLFQPIGAACVGEIPELIALQKKHADNLVIIGVSLDYVPDEYGHIGGHAAVEEQKHSAGDHDDHEATAAALKRVREKVARTAQARGINYPVLLDEKNEVGGRFNGGELPTTVIVDGQGNVRRRFIGARNQAVFEAMIAEASQSQLVVGK